jgi:hypothetical protein
MRKEAISRGEVCLIHPITGSFILLDNDGNIRFGLEVHGDALVITKDNHMYINCDRVHYITSSIEWNNLSFNKAAVNPSQPALLKTTEEINKKEISNYDRLTS